jgi:hypothetical protein
MWWGVASDDGMKGGALAQPDTWRTMTNVSRTNSTAPTTAPTGSSAPKTVRSGSMTGANYWAHAPLPSNAAAVAAAAGQLQRVPRTGTPVPGTTQGVGNGTQGQGTTGSTVTGSAQFLTPPPVPFAGTPGSSLVSSYGSIGELANDAEIEGGDDRQRFHSAMTKLANCQANPKSVSPESGNSNSQATLTLTPAQMAAIQAAPNAAAAKQEVLKAISAQTGIPVDQLDPTGAGEKGNRKAREALNALLGTNIKDGREKNAGSAILLDAICESVANGVRALPAASAAGASGMVQGMGGEFPGINDPAAPSPGTGVPVAPERPAEEISLDDYLDPAKDIKELNSPLIFDLSGTGLKLKQGELIEIDIDGDGKKEVITNLDKGMGLLVFDSKCQVRGDTAAGRDYFGDRTDLSFYGIVPRSIDKRWANGFEPLRAMAEHFELVRKDKQYLDAADLAFLEKEVGLRMRLDGVKGSDRRFADVGITRIDLGDARKVVSMRDAKDDAFGNKIMTQAGATFVVKGKTREYADLWFNVQARAKATAESHNNAASAAGAASASNAAAKTAKAPAPVAVKASSMSFARRM